MSVRNHLTRGLRVEVLYKRVVADAGKKPLIPCFSRSFPSSLKTVVEDATGWTDYNKS